MNKAQSSIRLSFTLIISILTLSLAAQDLNRVRLGDYEREIERKIIQIPDIPGHVTLKGDFHSHTVFSDGHVWPDVRVTEAWKEGLDVIAITDHIEYQPHKDYIKGDHNVSHTLAESTAEELNIILIKGAEMNRSMPPGHFNALFVKDINPIVNDDIMVQIEAAARQGAFILWNHPGWDSQQPDTTLWWDFHTTVLDKGWLHGVEVGNGGEWYPVAVDWCRDRKLTVFANSDLHPPSDLRYDFSIPVSHRTMTLVFSKDRSGEGVKEALFSRRTLAFTGVQLMGPEELIVALFHASVRLHSPYISRDIRGQETNFRELDNPTDLTFILEKVNENREGNTIRLNPKSTQILKVPAGEHNLQYRLLNCWTGSREHPLVTLE